MKAKIEEYSDTFSVYLEAETVAEAAKLVRLGVNSVKNSSLIYTSAHNTGALQTSIYFKKMQNANSDIPRRKQR
jgi:hypothetical protein